MMKSLSGLLVATVLLVGCGEGGPSPVPERQTAQRTPLPAEQSDNGDSPPTADDQPGSNDRNDAHDRSVEAATGAPPQSEEGGGATDEQLMALGATRQTWEKHHEQAAGYAEGAAYGPILSGDQPTYGGVFGDDRILAYDFYAPAAVSDEEFLALVETQELPPDAVPTTTIDCVDGPVHYYTSATISELIPGATAVYAAVGRYPESPYVAATIGVAFGDQSC